MALSDSFPALEALLFLSGEPIAKDRLGKLLMLPKKELDDVLTQYGKSLQERQTSGLVLIQNDSSVELATKKDQAALLEAFTKGTLQEGLSKASLEVLSIICYRSPITRGEIDALRGVNCSFTLRNLLLRGLIERRENPQDQREYVYEPSIAFLEHLGVGSAQELPQYDILSQDERALHIAGVSIEEEPSL